MAYRRFQRSAKPQVRTITVKHAGKCLCCGAEIKAGEIADYFPAGTVASRTTPGIAHVGGLDGNSARCAANISDRAVNDYAGDGLDERWEDQGRDICGL